MTVLAGYLHGLHAPAWHARTCMACTHLHGLDVGVELALVRGERGVLCGQLRDAVVDLVQFTLGSLARTLGGLQRCPVNTTTLTSH